VCAGHDKSDSNLIRFRVSGLLNDRLNIEDPRRLAFLDELLSHYLTGEIRGINDGI